MSKAVVWGVVVIIAIIAIVLIATSGGEPEGIQVIDDSPLPDVGDADYRTFETSNDDFSALDEALNELG